MALASKRTRSLANDVSISADIFYEHWDFIRKVIRYHVRDVTQADDLFQDVFLSLVSSPPPVGVKNIRSFIYRVITNEIADAADRVKRYQTRIHRYAERTGYSAAGQEPENVLIKTEETNRIFEAIERHLRCSQARAIELRFRHHFRVKDVAEIMDVNHGTVRKYISTGLKKLRQCLRAV